MRFVKQNATAVDLSVQLRSRSVADTAAPVDAAVCSGALGGAAQAPRSGFARAPSIFADQREVQVGRCSPQCHTCPAPIVTCGTLR